MRKRYDLWSAFRRRRAVRERLEDRSPHRGSFRGLTLFGDGIGKKPSQLGLDSSRLVEGGHKGAPLFGGNGKFALVGESVFGLEASAFDNEIGDAGASQLRAGAN